MKLFFLCLTLFYTSASFAEPIMVLNNQQELWTESLGEKKGEDNAILFVHGCGSHAYTWNDYLLQHFVDQGYFVIRYDQRNIGLSGTSYDEFDMIDLAADAVAILDEYGIEKAHLVGHSMGGMISQFIAANYPDRLHSLTLMSTAPVGMTKRLEQALTWDELKLTAQTALFLAAPLPKEYERALPLYLYGADYFNGDYPLDKEMATEYIHQQYFRTRHPFGEGGAKHAAVVFELMKTLHEREEIFNFIHTPALIIHGKKDSLILSTRGGTALHEALQDSELKLYPKMGHGFFNKELITDLCECTMEFIGKHREPSSI